MKHDIDKLRWIRVFTPVHIPKYLVEQIKQRDYSVEDFYKYQELNCLVKGEKGPVLNPFNHLYVLVDEGNLCKGFLWFVIDPLSKDGVVNTFSMDKAYWNNGKAMKKASDHVKELLKKLKLEKVFWITRYAKHSERHGFKRSKSILMEYKEEDNGADTDGGNNARGEHLDANTPATAGV